MTNGRKDNKTYNDLIDVSKLIYGSDLPIEIYARLNYIRKMCAKCRQTQQKATAENKSTHYSIYEERAVIDSANIQTISAKYDISEIRDGVERWFSYCSTGKCDEALKEINDLFERTTPDIIEQKKKEVKELKKKEGRDAN